VERRGAGVGARGVGVREWRRGVGGLENADWRLAIGDWRLGIGVASGVPVRGVNAGNSFVAETRRRPTEDRYGWPERIEGAALGATLASLVESGCET